MMSSGVGRSAAERRRATDAPRSEVSYSVTFSAAPAGNYQYSVTGGALPPGLSLKASTGVLGGTPTTAGGYNFTIMAKLDGNCTGARSYTLTINPAPCPPSITLTALPNGKVKKNYNNSVSATPAGSYTYSVSGTLPFGLSLNTTSGVVSGSPTTAGSCIFTITATKNGVGGCSGSRSYAVTITP